VKPRNQKSAAGGSQSRKSVETKRLLASSEVGGAFGTMRR
jgi:hypothetical protein